ncbi:substance-P receptor-like [Stylophora pistillata]|uniref:substance-P receptor-like n=1 Tax=Stylophora pistillata TaxID=50429 RepID=UPI000C04C172|nr:substance-P receptor-like [Stylophora pistillata]
MNYPNNSSYPNASLSGSSSPELEPRYAVTLLLTLSAIICSIGVLGNILVVIITGANRVSKTAVNKYILNLAIADIGVLAISYPLTFEQVAVPENWPLGRFVCKFVYPFTEIFPCASIGSIVAIAIDRHTAIVRGMTAYRSRTIAKWVILAIWITSFMSSAFPIYLVMEYKESNGTVKCAPEFPSSTTEAGYKFSMAIFWYVIPLFLILWAYRQIACKIRDS